MTSTSPLATTTALNARSDVAPTCAGPRPSHSEQMHYPRSTARPGSKRFSLISPSGPRRILKGSAVVATCVCRGEGGRTRARSVALFRGAAACPSDPSAGPPRGSRAPPRPPAPPRGPRPGLGPHFCVEPQRGREAHRACYRLELGQARVLDAAVPQVRNVGAGDDPARGVLQVLPAPLGAVGPAVERKQTSEPFRDMPLAALVHCPPCSAISTVHLLVQDTIRCRGARPGVPEDLGAGRDRRRFGAFRSEFGPSGIPAGALAVCDAASKRGSEQHGGDAMASAGRGVALYCGSKILG